MSCWWSFPAATLLTDAAAFPLSALSAEPFIRLEEAATMSLPPLWTPWASTPT